jgi:hypothetical protein
MWEPMKETSYYFLKDEIFTFITQEHLFMERKIELKNYIILSRKYNDRIWHLCIHYTY